jgi:hypothetical protein
MKLIETICGALLLAAFRAPRASACAERETS